MIVGRGSIAKLLNDREGFLFFACGASNSRDTTALDATRELAELFNTLDIDHDMLVYFSTISIFTNDTPYTYHKKLMELQVKQHFVNYCILRLGNVWECTNPNTFINAYKRQPYEPRDEWRYMISKEQLNFITDNLPRTGQHEISVFGEMVKVKDALKRETNEIRINSNS